MPPQGRPNGYGLIDDTLSNQPAEYPRELPEAGVGWPIGSTPRAVEFNHTLTRHAKWIHRFDQQTPTHPLFFGVETTRLTTQSFEYDTGAGLEATAQSDSAYVVLGYVVDLSLEELDNQDLFKHTFTASKDTHVHVSSAGVVRFSIVTIGVPPDPEPDELYLGTMTTDATSRVSWASGTDDPSMYRFRIAAAPLYIETAMYVKTSLHRWVRDGGTQRVHRRENTSASAKGYTLSDTVTHEGKTGNGQVLALLGSQHLPTDGVMTVSAQASAVKQGDATVYGVAFFTTRYRRVGGTLTTISGTSPTAADQNGVLTSPTLDTSGGTIAILTGFGTNTANVEIAFRIACAIA